MVKTFVDRTLTIGFSWADDHVVRVCKTGFEGVYAVWAESAYDLDMPPQNGPNIQYLRARTIRERYGFDIDKKIRDAVKENQINTLKEMVNDLEKGK